MSAHAGGGRHRQPTRRLHAVATLLSLLASACAQGPLDRLLPADEGGVPQSESGESGESGDTKTATRDPSLEPYVPDRRDYAAFRSAHFDLLDPLEPNYLPFMVHRIPGSPLLGDDLVFCRWPSERMPLRVYIRPPNISEALQDEFRPIDPDQYTESVARMLGVWEAELEGLVRFRRVETSSDADLEIRIRGEVAPIDREREVLGATTALLDACQPMGWDRDSQRLVVAFDVPELEIYVADRHGLLMPKQVARVALHELGHALGMFGHSPMPTDLMYRVARDRPLAESLSAQDVNSFVSLYSLPNGSHYARVPPGGLPERPAPLPPSGGPSLAGAPHVDTRFGFDLRTPHGWLRLQTPHGLFTANGPLWDYDVSIELMIWPARTIEHFLERFSDELLQGAWLRRRTPMRLEGRRTLRIEFEDESGVRAEELTLVEISDDRVLAIHTRCPVAAADAWRPWFRASLATLEIWTQPGGRAKVP